MRFLLAGLVLALMWAAVTGSFSFGNILFGGVVGFVALWLMRDRIAQPTLYRRFARGISLSALFLYELSLSALRVAVLVIRPDMKRHLKPAIIAFPLRVKSDPEITLLANLITLTPGTLSVDVSNDRKVLYVHAPVRTRSGQADRRHRGRFRAKDHGGLRMSGEEFLSLAASITLVILSIAFILTTFRVVRGPELADRVLALDMLVSVGIGFIAVIAIKTGFTLYLDIAIALSLVGFLSTVAFARYILTHGKSAEASKKEEAADA